MTTTTEAPPGWFEKIPDKQEKQLFADTLIAYLADRGFGDGKEDTIVNVTHEIVERLDDPGQHWH